MARLSSRGCSSIAREMPALKNSGRSSRVVSNIDNMTTTIDTEALAAELRAQVRGEVRFDEGSRALYATDSSNYRQVPIGIVIPKDVDDVTKTVEVCRRYGAPLL